MSQTGVVAAGEEVADALRAALISPNVPDSNLEPANVVDVIAGAGLNISRALKKLGVNDAATNMGAIEVLAKDTGEGLQAISLSLDDVADALREIASALKKP